MAPSHTKSGIQIENLASLQNYRCLGGKPNTVGQTDRILLPLSHTMLVTQ